MKEKPMPPYIEATPAGGLRLNTKHPEWIKYFTKYILKYSERMKKIVR